MSPVRVTCTRSTGSSAKFRLGVTWFLVLGLGLLGECQAVSTRTCDEFAVEVWQTEDGLPQNSVTSIAQTRDGYLWLATFGGLARFDGVRFTVYHDHNTPALTSSSVVRLDPDAEGGLWIITVNGGLARLLRGTLTGFTALHGLPPGGASAIAQVPNGPVWLRGRNGQLYQLEHGRFTPTQFPAATASEPLGSFGFDGDGTLWMRHGRRASKVEQGRLVPLRGVNGSSEISVRAMGPANNGGVVFVTSAGLQKYHHGWGPDIVPCPEEMQNLTCVCEDRDGHVWIGTFGHGLFQYHRASGWRHFETGNVLLHDTVRAVLEDREGNLWVGTDGGGLHRFKLRLFQSHGPNEGMTDSVVMSVTEGSPGVLWCGLNGGGINRLDAGRISQTAIPGLRTNEYVYSVLADRADTLWIGTYDRGLLRYQDGRLGPSPPGGPSTGAIFALMQDEAGAVWAGGSDGLWVFRPTRSGNAGSVSKVEFQPAGQNSTVHAIAQDHSRQMYVGTDGAGVYVLGTNTILHLTERDGLADNHVSAIYVDPENAIWFGGRGAGLSRLKNGKLHCYSAAEGLPTGHISSILGDDHGRLWVGCERGVFSVGRADFGRLTSDRPRLSSVTLYGHPDGLPGLQCSGGVQPACWKTKKGELYFATVKGLAVVNPNNLSTNRVSPPIAIEEVVMDGRTVDLSSHSGAAENSPAIPANPGGLPVSGKGRAGSYAPLKISPSVQRLEFRFTALSFVAPEKVRFRYIMDGYDNEWTEAGTRRFAEYTRIAPGHYRFRVTGCNNDGKWNEQDASLALLVLPPWWLTWWFRTLAVAVLTSLVIAAVELRMRRVKVQQERERAFSSKLIQSQEDERARIASGLHDSVGQDLLVIKNRALLGLRDGTFANDPKEQFHEISRIASSGLVQVREISYNLRPYQLDRLGLTRALQSMIAKVSGASGLECDAALESIDSLLPPRLEIHVYRIVQELLNNVVKHSNASKARISAVVQVERKRRGLPIIGRGITKTILLQVSDDGCGFDPEHEAGAAPGASGIGLRDITERVRILGATMRCESQRAQGTAWTICVPIKNHVRHQ